MSELKISIDCNGQSATLTLSAAFADSADAMRFGEKLTSLCRGLVEPVRALPERRSPSLTSYASRARESEG